MKYLFAINIKGKIEYGIIFVRYICKKIHTHMKRTLLLTALSATLFLSNRAEAQVPVVSKVLPKVTVGLKVGANFQDLSSNSSFQNSYQGGVVGGAFVGITKHKWGVQVEGLVKSVKYSFSDALQGLGASSDVNTVYLDVPVLLEYKIIPRLWVQLGPQFSDLLSAKSGGTDQKSDFKSSDFSGVLGLQAILPLHFILGARYIYGFSDINNQSSPIFGTDAWRNRSFQIYLGWRFL